MARMNPADLTKMLAGSPEYQDLVRAFGSPEAAAAAVRGKAHAAAMQTVRPSNTAIDLMSGTGMVAPDPERGLQFSGDPTRGPISAATIPGVAENAGRNAFFTSQGTHLGTPEYKPAGPGGTPTPMYPPPNPNAPPAVGAPGAAPAAAPALPPVGAGAAGQGSYFGPHASPTSLTEEQRLKQGTDAGVAYQSELSKNASGALGVVRSVSEMRNLLKASGDPNATTPVRAQMWHDFQLRYAKAAAVINNVQWYGSWT
jgi:hypothetical protein